MFTLKRIINGRVNVSEPLYVASGVTSATTFKAGTAVAYTNGKLTTVTGDTTAEYVVIADTTVSKASDEVALLLITKDMLFDAPVSVVPTGMVAGKKYTISGTSDGVTATAATSGFGAYVVSTNGATAAGDVITVRLS